MTGYKLKKRNVQNTGVAQATNYICSVTDPFCKHAEGAKSPFGSRQQTVSYTIKGFVDLTTPASGLVSILFRPVCGQFGFLFDTPATATWTAAASYANDSGAHPSFVEQARLVSGGIRWWDTIPATSGGGSVAVVPIPDDNELLDGAAHSWASLQNSPDVELTNIRDQGAYVFRMVDVPKAQEFTDINNTGATQNNGYEAVLLNVTGPASTKVLIVEWCLHFEGVIDVTQSLRAGRVQRPISLGLSAQSVSRSGYFFGNEHVVSEKLKMQAKALALRLLKAGAKKAGQAALTYAFGPAAGVSSGLLMDQIPEVD